MPVRKQLLTPKQRKEDLVNEVIEEFIKDIEMDCLDPMKKLLAKLKVRDLKEFLPENE